MIEVLNKPKSREAFSKKMQLWIREYERVLNDIAHLKEEYRVPYNEIIQTYNDAIEKARSYGDEIKANELLDKLNNLDSLDDYASARIPNNLLLVREGYMTLINAANDILFKAKQYEDAYYYLVLTYDFPSGLFGTKPFELQDIIGNLRICMENAFLNTLDPEVIQKPEVLALRDEKVQRLYGTFEDTVDANTFFNLVPITMLNEVKIIDLFPSYKLIDSNKQDIQFFLDEDENIFEVLDSIDKETLENAVRTICSDSEQKIYIRHIYNSDYTKEELFNGNRHIIRNGLMELSILSELQKLCETLSKDAFFAKQKSAIDKLKNRISKQYDNIKPLDILPQYLMSKEELKIYSKVLSNSLTPKQMTLVEENFQKQRTLNESLKVDNYKICYDKYAKSYEKRHGKGINKIRQKEKGD